MVLNIERGKKLSKFTEEVFFYIAPKVPSCRYSSMDTYIRISTLSKYLTNLLQGEHNV